MEYSARWYKVGDEEEIVDLLVSCLGGWPKFDLKCSPLDHWKWKYQHSLEDHKIVVTESGGRMIGCLHTINTLIKAGDQNVLGDQGSDLVVHPDYRGIGVYNRMNALYDNLVLSYSLSGNPIVYEKAIRTGCMPFPKPISQLIRIRDIDRHLAIKEGEHTFLKKYGFKTLAYFYKKRHGKKGELDPEVKLSYPEEFGDEVDAFWERVNSSLDFAVVRDREYLNWRYSDSRAGEFRVVTASKNGELMGYSVLRINRYDPSYPVGYVADMMTLPTEPAVQSILFDDAVRYFDGDHVNCVHFWAIKGSSLMKMSLMHGFVPAPYNFLMWFSSRNSFKTDFLTGSPCERLHIALGDTDWL